MPVMISAWARHASIGDPKFADIARSAKFSIQANRPGNRLLGMSPHGTWTRIYVLRKIEIEGAILITVYVGHKAIPIDSAYVDVAINQGQKGHTSLQIANKKQGVLQLVLYINTF